MIPREEAKVILGGNSLAVQQLDAALPMQGAHVQSLVRELRSHMTCDLTKKKKKTVILGDRKWFSSVQFSRSVMSDSLQPRELQHARPPCPSPTSRVYPDSYPLSQ